MDRPRRAAVAVVAAIAVAEAAALLLRPRNGIIAPAPVDPGSYFTPAEIDRARRYRRGQLALFVASLAVDGALLGALVRSPPSVLVGPFRRPVVAGGAAAAALSAGFTGAGLPIAAIGHRRSVAVGLSTQTWRAWLADAGKSTAVGTVFAGGGGAAAVALMRRFPRTWWAGGSVAVVAFAAAMLYAGPVVLDPIFNRFDRLAPGQARDDVLDLARQAGVDVGEVYRVDASRRTTASNAYVTGLGPTKRVVLFDNLLEDFGRDEVRLVVAHELAHVRHRDVTRGLLYVALVAPAAALAAATLTERLAPADAERGPAVLPALGLSSALVGLGVGSTANQLSRRIEARADSFSLTLTDAPGAFIDFERAITVKNVADPDPPRWLAALLATHPPTVQRIGIAKAYEAGAR